MLRFPDVSATHIVFAYANDLWIVPKAGGVASPLASPPGAETFPKFSPDGKSIAFVGNYDGSRDIYTIGLEGGVPNRVTHHPGGENVADWTPDGKSILFLTNALAGLARQTQAFTVPATGGTYTKLPVPYSGFGAISPDGTWYAYTPHSTDTRTWKRYRGGMATDIWLYNLKDNTFKQATDWEGTDTLPMWVPGGTGDVVYYLSDNGPEHRLNIWSYDLKAGGGAGTRTQVTTFADDDIRWPSVGPGSDGKGEIVFQLGAKLMLLNLGTKQSAEVKVTIPGDRPKLKSRTVDAAPYISGAALGPGNKRVVIEARGDLFTAPVKEGVIRALTRTDGIAERDPAWSPDGKWIAYFSDETGENELYIRSSDAKAPEDKKDDKKAEGAKAEGGKDEAKKKEEAKPAAAAPAAPRQVSKLGAGYRTGPQWSPDSKFICMTDQNGRLFLTDVEAGTTKEIDKDAWMNQISVSWSHDSKWIAYRKSDEKITNGIIWIMDVKTGERRQVTSGMFDASFPAFDRKGDYLFYRSQMAVDNPVYSDVDTTYAYTNSEVLLMAPLRKDVKSPYLPESDEETLKKEEKKKDEAKPGDKKDEPKKDDKPAEAAKADDGISGTWTGTVKGNVPELQGGLPLTLKITVDAEGKVSGTVSTAMGSGGATGTFAKSTGELDLTVSVNQMTVTMKAKLENGQLKGTWSAPGPDGNPMAGEWTATRSKAAGGGEEKKDDKAAGDGAKKDEAKELKIDFEGLEARSIKLEISPGNFGPMAVADGDKLLFTRNSSRGGRDGGIKIFDYKSSEGKEEAVTGGGGWQLSADGKKILVVRGTSVSIVDASAGGGKAQTVPTAGMTVTINPREEWKEIFTDAWRVMRDYFYEPTMHGVDWEGMKKHYGAMLDDAASREDVNWIISEMISELNIGHAYLGAPGDVEGQPTSGVGLLGADFALDATDGKAAYRITRLINGGPWDADARGPLSQPGMDVKVGDYVLAVDGVPIDTSKDFYASFAGTQNRTISLTVNAAPTLDGKQREVLVKPIANEGGLRYRAYIEEKRLYVEKKTEGKVGYIYVPNTGVDGQNDLYRQFFGQRGKEAIIVDERWNGGGQIPTRFIELLNRPATNYWARRDGHDWAWPPDAFFGHKCMLINGLAGSGGDMFPWLFKHNKLGPVIGRRTWGGLVGISGNPQFIDGGSITVPNFGFYETDGTWGVEGHGTDPDIDVLDDPSKMVAGADPQLDRGIEEMMKAVQANPYTPPKRPASPTYRKGMGIQPADK